MPLPALPQDLLIWLQNRRMTWPYDEPMLVSPPPWADFYPPKGFLDHFEEALRAHECKTIHYIGISDETIWRRLLSLAGVTLTMMDMASIWVSRLKVPAELEPVRFYSEGVPDADALICDTAQKSGLLEMLAEVSPQI